MLYIMSKQRNVKDYDNDDDDNDDDIYDNFPLLVSLPPAILPPKGQISSRQYSLQQQQFKYIFI